LVGSIGQLAQGATNEVDADLRLAVGDGQGHEVGVVVRVRQSAGPAGVAEVVSTVGRALAVGCALAAVLRAITVQCFGESASDQPLADARGAAEQIRLRHTIVSQLAPQGAEHPRVAAYGVETAQS